MSELQELNLYRSQITNAGLAKLQRLKKLTDLDLRYTRATGSGVEAMRRALPEARILFQDAAPAPLDAAARTSKPAAATQPAIAKWIEQIGGKAR